MLDFDFTNFYVINLRLALRLATGEIVGNNSIYTEPKQGLNILFKWIKYVKNIKNMLKILKILTPGLRKKNETELKQDAVF